MYTRTQDICTYTRMCGCIKYNAEYAIRTVIPALFTSFLWRYTVWCIHTEPGGKFWLRKTSLTLTQPDVVVRPANRFCWNISRRLSSTSKLIRSQQTRFQKDVLMCRFPGMQALPELDRTISFSAWGARWLSGRVSDSGARGPGFETYLRRVVSLSKTLYSPKVLVNYPGSDGSVPTWLKNCWLGR